MEEKKEEKKKKIEKIGMNILFEKDLHEKLSRMSKASDQTCSAYIRSLIRAVPEKKKEGGLEELNLEDIQKAVENGKTIFDF